MKIKRHTLGAMLFIALSLVCCSDLFAQPGRYSHGRGYAYGRSYRYYPTVRSTVRYYPQRIYYSSRPYVDIYHGGINYRYQQGYYYRPYGSTFRFVVPPFGLMISTLPMGYRTIQIGPSPYYYYGGTYYRPRPNNRYEVVAPPLGAVVDQLPSNAKVTVIDGRKYYEDNGTYYEESISSNNKLEYTVVGTDGVLNTEGMTNEQVSTEPAIGDRFEDLPSDSKAIVINGEKLYLAPSGLYYKEVIDGDRVYYEVVGS